MKTNLFLLIKIYFLNMDARSYFNGNMMKPYIYIFALAQFFIDNYFSRFFFSMKSFSFAFFGTTHRSIEKKKNNDIYKK
jgi:hypothetical protein